MDNGMMELNLEAMEMVDGGVDWGKIFDKFDKADVMILLCGGPIGEAIEIVKLVHEYNLEKDREAKAS